MINALRHAMGSVADGIQYIAEFGLWLRPTAYRLDKEFTGCMRFWNRHYTQAGSSATKATIY
jgi:hypothetical protein